MAKIAITGNIASGKSVVETVLKALNERNIATDKNQTIIELTKNYLAKEINFHSNYYIGAYDLLLELLFGFLQLEKEEIIIKKTDIFR